MPKKRTKKAPASAKANSKIKTTEMEIAVAELFNFRTNIIVPNVSWGLGLNHECDLLILDSKNRFTEVEIKISMADLKQDFLKKHGHRSPHITRMFYAVPDYLFDEAQELIPKEFGLISVRKLTWGSKELLKANFEKVVQHKRKAVAIKPEMIHNFCRLGCMRIWTLKNKLNKIK